jgi:hypothetical protein
MVVSVELPYYLLGMGSFQMERMVQIGASGAEVLDRLPFELDAQRGATDAEVAPAPRHHRRTNAEAVAPEIVGPVLDGT